MHTSSLDLESARLVSISNEARALVDLLSDEEIDQVNTVWAVDNNARNLALQIAYAIEGRRGPNPLKCYVVNNRDEADVFAQSVLFCMDTLTASNSLCELRQAVIDAGGTPMGTLLCRSNPCLISLVSMMRVRTLHTTIS